MKSKNLTLVRQFVRNHRHRVLMVGMLLLYSCELTDDEVLNSRQAFISSFEMNQQCTIGGSNSTEKYTLQIRAGSSSNSVWLTNLEPFPNEIEAIVSGNILTIPSQKTPYRGQNIEVSGSGTLTDGSILEINFEFEYGDFNTCEANGFKL